MIPLSLSDEEHEKIRCEANETERTMQDVIREKLYGTTEHLALLGALSRLERSIKENTEQIKGLRQDFRAVYFPNHDL